MSEDGLRKKIEKRIKERDSLCEVIQADINSLAEKINKLTDHDLKTYQALVKPDALYNDCPISKFWTFHWLKDYMIKKDMDFIGYVLDGKASVVPFAEKSKEASKWILRFAKEEAPLKTGIKAIVEGE